MALKYTKFHIPEQLKCKHDILLWAEATCTFAQELLEVIWIDCVEIPEMASRWQSLRAYSTASQKELIRKKQHDLFDLI